MTKWQYQSLKFETYGFSGGILETDEFDAALNQMGAQGWEPVAIFDANHVKGGTRFVVATFKRAL